MKTLIKWQYDINSQMFILEENKCPLRKYLSSFASDCWPDSDEIVCQRCQHCENIEINFEFQSSSPLAICICVYPDIVPNFPYFQIPLPFKEINEAHRYVQSIISTPHMTMIYYQEYPECTGPDTLRNTLLRLFLSRYALKQYCQQLNINFDTTKDGNIVISGWCIYTIALSQQIKDDVVFPVSINQLKNENDIFAILNIYKGYAQFIGIISRRMIVNKIKEGSYIWQAIGDYYVLYIPLTHLSKIDILQTLTQKNIQLFKISPQELNTILPLKFRDKSVQQNFISTVSPSSSIPTESTVKPKFISTIKQQEDTVSNLNVISETKTNNIDQVLQHQKDINKTKIKPKSFLQIKEKQSQIKKIIPLFLKKRHYRLKGEHI